MAFPQVDAAITQAFTAAFSHNVTMPSTVVKGDLLLVLISVNDNRNIGKPVGWEELWHLNFGTFGRGGAYAKVAIGDEASTTVDFPTGLVTEAASQVYRISAWPGDLATGLYPKNDLVSDSGTDPNPGLNNPSIGTLNWLAIAACNYADDDATLDGIPTDYTDSLSALSGTGTDESASVGSARREVNAASENPGAFTLSASQQWISSSYLIREAFVPVLTDVETTEEFRDGATAITIAGHVFEAVQGTGKVEISDNAVYASGTKVAQTVTSWSDTAIDITAVLGALAPGPLYMWVTNDNADINAVVFPVTVHRKIAFALSASANITASGENTTVQLTAPATKTTGDFGGGRIMDDENPGDAVDLAADEYREDEWSIEATTDAVDSQQYEFRVLIGGFVSEVISKIPKWTIASGPTQHNQTIAGNLPAQSGAIVATHGFPISIGGTLGALTGAIANRKTGFVAAAGTLGSLAGVLVNRKTGFVAAAGTLGALTGTVAHAGSTFKRSMAGTLGAFSGTHATVRTAFISIAGTLGAFTGAVSHTRTTLVSIAGTLGAFTADLASIGVIGKADRVYRHWMNTNKGLRRIIRRNK